jgi:hypothetical protein
LYGDNDLALSGTATTKYKDYAEIIKNISAQMTLFNKD